jgi:MFS family permease
MNANIKGKKQFSGINIISSFGAFIFQNSVGLGRNQSLIVNGMAQVWYFLSSITVWFLVDRVGRRRLFMIGSGGMGLMMVLSAVFVGIGGRQLGFGAIVVIYLVQSFFTLGWQSNMWIYPSEILPLKLRLRGGAIAVISQWTWTFLIVEITPVMISNIGYKSYILFGIFNFATIPLVYFFFPETSQRPLEAIDLLFEDRDGKRPSIFRVVKDSADPEYRRKIDEELAERSQLREKNETIVESAKQAVDHVE